MADGDNQVRIAMKSSDREVEDRIQSLTDKAEGLTKKLREQGRVSRQVATEAKEDFEGTGHVMEGLVQKAGALGTALLGAFSVSQLKAFREELIKIGEEQARQLQEREKGLVGASRQAGLSAQGAQELSSIVGSGQSALSDQERVGLFNTIAGQVRPVTREDERAALQTQAILQRRGDALSAQELQGIGAGAGALYRQAGVDPQAGIGMATLAMQRGGSLDLVRQGGKLAGALADATPDLSPEERAASVLALTEEMDRAGVEAGSVKGILQRIEKSRAQGGAFTFTDPAGKAQRGALPVLTQGNTLDAFLGLVGAAQGGDTMAGLAAQSLLGEQGGAILGGVNLEAYRAGRSAYLGADAGLVDALQGTAMGNEQVRRDVEKRRATNSYKQNQQAQNKDALLVEQKLAEAFEEYQPGNLREWIAKKMVEGTRLVRGDEAALKQVELLRARNTGEADWLTGVDIRTAAEKDPRNSAGTRAVLEQLQQPITLNASFTFVQSGDGDVVDYSAALDSPGGGL